MKQRILSMALLMGGGVLLANSSPITAETSATDIFDLVERSFPDRGGPRRIADVDGDGKLDLSWVFSSLGDRKNYALRTCFQEPAPHFSVCTEFNLSEDVRALDIGEIDGQPGAEMLLITESGASLASFDGKRFTDPRPHAEARSLLSGTDGGPPITLRLLFDLDGDGRSEAILPRAEGPAIHRPQDGESMLGPAQLLASPAQVHYELDASPGNDLGNSLHRAHMRRVTTETTAPAVFIEDFDGDAKPDVVTVTGTQLRIFLQERDGAFDSLPTHLIERSILSETEKETDFAGEALAFADLNGDGPADLIILKWGSSDERTRMDRHLFFARPGLRYPDRADQIVRSESFFPNFEIEDLDGDGSMDLVIPFFHIATSQALKAVIQNTLRVQLRLFLMDENGRYSQDDGKTFAKVDRRVALDYHLDLVGMIFDDNSGIEGDFDPLLTMRGDFNGDGYKDLASDSGNDTLRIYWGNSESRYSNSPDHVVNHESVLISDLVDLNADGKTDIISYYTGAEPSPRNSKRAGAMNQRKRIRQNIDRQRERQRQRKEAAEGTLGPPPEFRIKVLMSR
ncbi:VCBS repeat-containing protein [Myxococcota bacterium]|nr:VCBS repeat-containing protein [Myxococcota bacterium]